MTFPVKVEASTPFTTGPRYGAHMVVKPGKEMGVISVFGFVTADVKEVVWPRNIVPVAKRHIPARQLKVKVTLRIIQTSSHKGNSAKE
jgi:hypothetical protein